MGGRSRIYPTPNNRHERRKPDGLIRDDGLIEIKCPNTAAHIEFLQNAEAETGIHLPNAMANGLYGAQMVRFC